MSIRVHLALALLVAALVPLAVVVVLGRPLLEDAGRRLAEREREAAFTRLAGAARERGRRALERAWALRGAAAREGLLDILAREPARRRERREYRAALRRLVTLAEGVGAHRGFLLRRGPDGTVVLARWPERQPPEPGPGLPSPDRVAWLAPGEGHPGAGSPVLLRAAAGWPPGRGAEVRLLLVVEETLPAGELAARLGEAAGAPVRLTRGRPGGKDVPAVRLPGSGLYLVADAPGEGARLLARARYALAWAALAAAGSALALALVLGGLLTAPVRSLARAVDRVADGDDPVAPMPGGPGEIGRLGARIERMLAALRREQAARARAERLAAWREVARRVAHEVRNPLTPIRLAVDNLERLAARDPGRLARALPEEADAIRREVVRLERLVREFHEFARLPAPRPAPVDLGRLVRGSLRARLGEEGPPRWEVRVEEGVPEVQADADLLGTVFTNLAGNAAEAGAGKLVATIRPAGPGRVEILCEDDGPGVPEDLKDRVFDPYVTGRGEAGTGLGLALCRRVVEDHGGVIELLPGGTGARFRIELPVAGPGR